MNSTVLVSVLTLTLFFLTGCGNPGFTEQGNEGPVWHNELNSEVDREGKIQNPNGKKGKKAQQKAPTQPDQPGDVVAQPPPPVAEADDQDAPPEWVEELEKEVETEKVGKQSKKRQSAKVVVEEDLIGESEAASEPAPLPPKKVDIVFIVDTSRSMSAFLRNVEKSFEDFIPALSSLDWRIFFTNADHGNNGLFLFNGYAMNGRAMKLEYKGEEVQNIRYLSKRVKDHEVVFLDTLRIHGSREFTYLGSRAARAGSSAIRGQRGVHKCHLPPYCQSWNEQPLKSLNSALVRNDEYFREDADVAAIIISDSSEGAGLRPEKRMTAERVKDTFIENHPNKNMIAYGILMIDEECQEEYGRGWADEDKFSVEIAELAGLTDGTNYSLCDDSYAPLARQIVSDFQH